ncbi:DUF222 domain-containing protein [Nocardioides sp. TF02-7]|uniref:DUF222 domain-containing protein n=1 Tax=Nocardioides sp. TF02-7 TaxID=2917724 RepID=UPI001F05688C|nr:DUF222 domain-containing protein [Nocardioides sp. TF02-7]UMG93140.1 13E12 repeat family protein [Nocardioides sp. TF02-7]
MEATFMPTGAKAAAITELHRAEQRLKALRLKVMAASSDVASENAAADVGSWLAHEVNADLRDARADQRLAKALDDRFPVVAAAFADGRVSEEQAWVIVRAVDALPKRVGTQVKADAEETLVDCAAQFTPTQLRLLGRHILHVVAPEIADDEDAKKLAEEEASAEERSRLSVRDLGDGTSRISGIIPTPAAKRLDAYLDAPHLTAAPRPRDRRGREPRDRDRVRCSRRGGAVGADHHRAARRDRDPRLPRRRRPDPPTPRSAPWRSAPCWSGSTLTGCLSTVGTPPPSWSPSRSRICVPTSVSPGSSSPTSSTDPTSPPPKPDAWPATPPSSPPSSAPTARSSTSAAPDASSPQPNGN